MDIEWAKDGEDGKLYIVQARPETVASQTQRRDTRELRAEGRGPGAGQRPRVGEKIAAGAVRVIASKRDLPFPAGRGAGRDDHDPDWEPVMKTAAAIVTDRGGRTCHAAIVARELGVPAVVGSRGATANIAKPAKSVTVSCAEGEAGQVYDGKLPFEVTPVASDAAAAAHQDHGQPRQSRAGLPDGDDAE